MPKRKGGHRGQGHSNKTPKGHAESHVNKMKGARTQPKQYKRKRNAKRHVRKNNLIDIAGQVPNAR